MQVRLEKIIIFCADVDKLVRFYQDCFQLTIIGEPDSNWTVLETGSVQIAFHKIGEEYLTTSPEAFKITDSNVKIVFEIDSDLVSFRESLLGKKVDAGDIRQFPGFSYRFCDGQDPEGNVFQVIQNIG